MKPIDLNLILMVNTMMILMKKILNLKLMIKNRKRKGHKLYVKWEGCDNFFNSWIHKKAHCKK